LLTIRLRRGASACTYEQVAGEEFSLYSNGRDYTLVFTPGQTVGQAVKLINLAGVQIVAQGSSETLLEPLSREVISGCTIQ
jgi:hypothetical protein